MPKGVEHPGLATHRQPPVQESLMPKGVEHNERDEIERRIRTSAGIVDAERR